MVTTEKPAQSLSTQKNIEAQGSGTEKEANTPENDATTVPLSQALGKLENKLDQLQSHFQNPQAVQLIEPLLEAITQDFAEILKAPQADIQKHKDSIIALRAKLDITLKKAQQNSAETRVKMTNLIQRAKLQKSYTNKG